MLVWLKRLIMVVEGGTKNENSVFAGSFGTVHRADWQGSVRILVCSVTRGSRLFYV